MSAITMGVMPSTSLQPWPRFLPNTPSLPHIHRLRNPRLQKETVQGRLLSVENSVKLLEEKTRKGRERRGEEGRDEEKRE